MDSTRGRQHTGRAQAATLRPQPSPRLCPTRSPAGTIAAGVRSGSSPRIALTRTGGSNRAAPRSASADASWRPRSIGSIAAAELATVSVTSTNSDTPLKTPRPRAKHPSVLCSESGILGEPSVSAQIAPITHPLPCSRAAASDSFPTRACRHPLPKILWAPRLPVVDTHYDL